MRILKMRMENFQGIKKLELNPQGRNVEIRGQNGAGKTTIFNAYTFGLFGTMWDGSTAKIHRRDEQGNEIYDGTIHAVEIEFYSRLENKNFTIRREVKDKFDKKGNFTGNATECFIDGVPTQATKFKTFIEQVTGGASAILSNPFNFFKMNWKDARKMLMNLFCKGVSDREIFAKKPELEILKDVLSDRPAENLILKLKSDIKNAENKLKDFGGQIKAYSEMSKIDGDKDNLQEELGELEEQFAEKTEQIRQLQNSDSKGELRKINRAIEEVKRAISELQIKFDGNEKKFAKLTSDYFATKKSQVGTCPTCGQQMPLDKFTAVKTQKLNELCSEGQRVKELREVYRQGLTAQKSELERLQNDAEKLQTNQTADNSEQQKFLQGECLEIRGKISNVKTKLLAIEQAERSAQKVKELKAEERKINEGIAEMQGQIELTESYIREKVRITEGKINSRFEFVRFKMFDRLKNGELKECCEPMLENIPYSNLSKGEKLKVALDVLRTLQKNFNVTLPIFIDDAESYTSNSLVEIDNQIFRLTATEGVKDLQIEVEKEIARKVA